MLSLKVCIVSWFKCPPVTVPALVALCWHVGFAFSSAEKTTEVTLSTVKAYRETQQLQPHDVCSLKVQMTGGNQKGKDCPAHVLCSGMARNSSPCP